MEEIFILLAAIKDRQFFFIKIFKTNEHPVCDLLGWLVSQSSVYHLVRISIHGLFLGFDNAQTKITPITLVVFKSDK